MDRLTNTGADGKVWISNTNETRKLGQKQAAYQKLKTYEDIGLTPDEIYQLKAAVEKLRWIPVTERLPEEQDSLFTKLKGTDEWKKGMFAGASDDVLVTIECEDGGLEKCQTAKIIDGEWKNTFLRTFSGAKVIAWMPFPEAYKEK